MSQNNQSSGKARAGIFLLFAAIIVLGIAISVIALRSMIGSPMQRADAYAAQLQADANIPMWEAQAAADAMAYADERALEGQMAQMQTINEMRWLPFTTGVKAVGGSTITILLIIGCVIVLSALAFIVIFRLPQWSSAKIQQEQRSPSIRTLPGGGSITTLPSGQAVLQNPNHAPGAFALVDDKGVTLHEPDRQTSAVRAFALAAQGDPSNQPLLASLYREAHRAIGNGSMPDGQSIVSAENSPFPH